MYKEHSVFEKPEDENAKIWRYMDFTKFVSMLDKSALFFSKADKLGDPLEGSFSKANINLRPTVYGDTKADVREKMIETMSRVFRQLPRFTFINCWHLNEYESAAMWKLYIKSDEGIAIQSTFERLRDSMKGENHEIYIGKVKYMDYENDWLPERNSYSPFVHKRKSFEHEHELRAVIQELPKHNDKINLAAKLPFDDGIYVSVDLDSLVDRVYLSPTCPKWLFELVKSVTSKYNLVKDIRQSSLDDKPVY